MSKRKPMDKAQARERRNRLLESAAAAELSLTNGVREMRAIAGMTQEEFARHRGVSARVIKAVELGQGNPTVATLNRIGQFFGLEVAFVPVRRHAQAEEAPQLTDDLILADGDVVGVSDRKSTGKKSDTNNDITSGIDTLAAKLAELEAQLDLAIQAQRTLKSFVKSAQKPAEVKSDKHEDIVAPEAPALIQKKPRTS